MRTTRRRRRGTAAPAYAPMPFDPPFPPVRSALPVVAVRCSAALAWLSAVAAVIGFGWPSLFHDTAVTVGNARGTALVILLVGAPALAIAVHLATAASARLHVLWLGALAFLLYNAVVFAFDVAFNSLFLLYVLQLSLAVWATISLAVWLRDRIACFTLHASAPRRLIGGYLVATALLWAAFWLRDIIPALLANGPPAGLAATRMLTNPFEVMDLAFTLPLAALSGLWIWQRQARGALVGGALLTFLTIEGISVAVDQTFGHLADPSQPLSAIPIILALTGIGLVPTILLYRAVRLRAS